MPVETSTNVRVVCEGRNCLKHEVAWVAGVTKPEELPPEAYKSLTLIDFTGKKYVFLGKTCLQNWLKNYTELEPPKPVAPKEPPQVLTPKKESYEALNPTLVTP